MITTVSPVNRLSTGKAFEFNIKNPIRYNTGNLSRIRAESFAGSFFNTLIFNMFIVKMTFAIDHEAPTIKPIAQVALLDKSNAMAEMITKNALIFIDLITLSIRSFFCLEREPDYSYRLSCACDESDRNENSRCKAWKAEPLFKIIRAEVTS